MKLLISLAGGLAVAISVAVLHKLMRKTGESIPRFGKPDATNGYKPVLDITV